MDNFATHHTHYETRERSRSHYSRYRYHRGYRKRTFCCVNCGKEGHVYKQCLEPITSFGIIAIKKRSEELLPGTIGTAQKMKCFKHTVKNPDSIPVHNEDYNIMYLMVQRKDTMGYIDFIRGKYPDNDHLAKMTILKTYLEEMACEERDRLLKSDGNFEFLWDHVWMTKDSKLYINEYLEAREKFSRLNIPKLLDATECEWTQQEYGFPKGRKNMHETNIECAKREFREESGYTQNEIKIISDKPWEEIFVGTNGISYRHVYYIAEVPDTISLPRIDLSDVQQSGEISNIGWFTYEQCMKIIRPYDVAKKELLTRIHEKYKDRYTIGSQMP